MDPSEKRKVGRVEVYWTTITYRSILLGLLALLIFGLALYLALRPGATNTFWAWIEGKNRGGNGEAGVVEAEHARFINLDGTVRVKKRDSVQWINADFSTPLEEGDVVQTGPNGIARINFIDGSNYVVKQDTLIVIEQNTALQNRATKVAVQVTSGAVDLSTGTWDAPGSTSIVRFENAEARMEQNTRAAIRQDPNRKIHELRVSEGGALLARGSETIQVGPYERASFRDPNSPIVKEKVIAPPKLSLPRNLEPIISAQPRDEAIQFAWEPVSQARAYRLRVSPSPLFTSLVLDTEVRAPQSQFNARGLGPGEYYWNVIAVDGKNQKSQEGEAFRFSLHQGQSEELFLNVEGVIQHGRVVEIVGRTEPGASVTINAEPVANVGPDGRFKHFTLPLPHAGAHTITVVAQNIRGEVVMQKKQVVVQ